MSIIQIGVVTPTAGRPTASPAPSPAEKPAEAPQDTFTPSKATAPSSLSRIVFTVGTTAVAAQIGMVALGPIGAAAAFIGARHGWARAATLPFKHASIITAATLGGALLGHAMGGDFMSQACGAGFGFVAGEVVTGRFAG
jgi:hypothetical protein